MAQPDELTAIVQRMIDAGESEENIATVIQHFQAQPAAPETTFDKAMTFAGTAAKTALSDMAQPFLHPIETLQGLAQVGPMVQTGLRAAAGDPEAAGRVKEGVTGTLRALSEMDPAELTGHVAGFALGPKAIGGLAGAARGAVKGTSLRLMQSALKPTAALEKARAGAGYGSKSAIAKAVLDEGRIVSGGSLAKAQEALDATDDAARTAIAGGAGRGATVDPHRVTQAIDDVGGQFSRQVNAQPDMAAIQGVREAFATNPQWSDPVTGMAPIPADLAHDVMTTTGKNLRGKFGRLGSATVEAEKAGRANISEQLRAGIPELEPLWQQEARQITVRDALEQATARRANTDPMGLSGIVGAVKSPSLAAMAMADRSALFKSLLAQLLNRVPMPRGGMIAAGQRGIMAGQRIGDEP